MPPVNVYSSPCPIPIRSAQQVIPPVALAFAHKNTLQQPPSSLDQPNEQSEPQNADPAISKTLLKTSFKSLGSFLGSFRETARLATRLQASICVGHTDTFPKRKKKSGTRRRKVVSSPNTAPTPSGTDEGPLHVLSQLRSISPMSVFFSQPKRHATSLPSQSTTKPGPALLRSFTASSRSRLLLDSARSLTQLPAAPVFTSHKTKRDRMRPNILATPIDNRRVPKDDPNPSGTGVSLTEPSKPSHMRTLHSSTIQKKNPTTSPSSRLVILAALQPHKNTIILSSR